MNSRLLEHSGGSRHFGEQLLSRYGECLTPWALLVSVFAVGLPVFFGVGFIILVPLAWSLTRHSAKNLLCCGLPMAGALTVVHAMVPPHAAPAALVAFLFLFSVALIFLAPAFQQRLSMPSALGHPFATRLIAVVGGGGAFQQVTVDSGVGARAGQLPVLASLFASLGLRLAQSSATVAMITSAGVLVPLGKDIPGQSPEILMLAICCGGAAMSLRNDAGFWMGNQCFGLTVPRNLRTCSVPKMITSVMGLDMILLLNALR